VRHRHLELPASTAAADLPDAAIDDLLDRGDLDDWRAILREIARNPQGPVAERVLRLVEQHPMQGTSALFRSWIETLRGKSEPAPGPGPSLAAIRRGRGLTQQQVADRLGMTQPEVSKLERRRDVRLSTLRAYVAALGGEPVVTARFDDEEHRIG